MAEPTKVANDDIEGQPSPSPDSEQDLVKGPEEEAYEGLVEPTPEPGTPETKDDGTTKEPSPARSMEPGAVSKTDGKTKAALDDGTVEEGKETEGLDNQGAEISGANEDGTGAEETEMNGTGTIEAEDETPAEPVEIELPDPGAEDAVPTAEWVDEKASIDGLESPSHGPRHLATSARNKFDPWALFTNVEEWLSILAILSLALLSFTILVLYRFNRIAGIQTPVIFNLITIIVGLAWALFALMGYGYLRNQAIREPPETEWDTIRIHLGHAALAAVCIGLLVGFVSIAAPSENKWEFTGPLGLSLLILAPLFSLLSMGIISHRSYPPAVLMTLGAIILGPGIWMMGNTGDFANSEPQSWNAHEFVELEIAKALLVLAGSAMVLFGTTALRHPRDYFLPWTLGSIVLAGIIGLSLGDATYEVGTLPATAGGGLLIVGGLISWRWRLAELSRRQEVIEAGKRAMERGKPVKALSLLDHAFRMASRDGVLLDEPKLWAQKGAALSQQRKYRRALVFLGVALELDPNDELVWFERGKLYSNLKRWSGAVECYSRAVSLKHDYIEAWLALSEAHIKVNANQEAQAAFGRVTQLAPRNIKGWLGLGRANAALGKVRQAVQAFDTASRIDPEAVPPYLAKAQVYYSLKLWEKAQQAYEMVIHLDPKSAEGWWKMAGCYLELRQTQMALNALNNYIDLEPENVNGLLRRAALHYDEGEYGEAISDIHLALELEPENEKGLQLKRIVLSHLDSRGKWR